MKLKIIVALLISCALIVCGITMAGPPAPIPKSEKNFVLKEICKDVTVNPVNAVLEAVAADIGEQRINQASDNVSIDAELTVIDIELYRPERPNTIHFGYRPDNIMQRSKDKIRPPNTFPLLT